MQALPEISLEYWIDELVIFPPSNDVVCCSVLKKACKPDLSQCGTNSNLAKPTQKDKQTKSTTKRHL